MNFKSIALIALLLPAAGYGKSTETRIKELKEFQYQTELLISNIGATIAAKSDWVDELTQEYLKKINDKNKESLDAFSNKISAAALEHKSIKKILVKELLDESGNCNSMKLLKIRILFEKVLMENLINQYEEHIQALMNSQQELQSLEK